jgi:hypothetical protein
MVFKKYCEFCKKELSFKSQQAYASHISIHKMQEKKAKVTMPNLFENLIKLTEQQLEIYKKLNEAFNLLVKDIEEIKDLEQRIIEILTFPKERSGE